MLSTHKNSDTARQSHFRSRAGNAAVADVVDGVDEALVDKLTYEVRVFLFRLEINRWRGAKCLTLQAKPFARIQ